MRRLAKVGTQHRSGLLYLVSTLAVLTGCHSYRPVTYTPLAPAEIELGFGSPRLLRVSRSRDSLTLTVTRIRGRVQQVHDDTAVVAVSTYWPPSETALSAMPVSLARGWVAVIPIHEVARVSIRQFSPAKTIPLVVVGGFAMAIVGFFALFAIECRRGCG